jgi:20S proteasome alpha/beta subunit
VTVLAERAFQPSVQKPFRSSAHSGTAISGIVGDGEELDVHPRK